MLTLKSRELLFLDTFFDTNSLRRGEKLWQDGHVLSLKRHPFRDGYTARVVGSTRRTYTVSCTWDSVQALISECSCPVARQCKHGAALALEMLDLYGVPGEHETLDLISPISEVSQFETWSQEFFSELGKAQALEYQGPDSAQADKSIFEEHLVYTIQFPEYASRLQVDLALSRCLKNGGYGQPKPFRPQIESNRRRMQEVDHDIFAQLQRMNMDRLSYTSTNSTASIEGQSGSKVLEHILKTGRCFWLGALETPLALGEVRALSMGWDLADSGNQSAAFQLHWNGAQEPVRALSENTSLSLFWMESAWYIDIARGQAGPVQSSLPLGIVRELISAPALPPEKIAPFCEQLQAVAHLPIPQPLPLKLVEAPPGQQLTPHLELDMVEIIVDSHLAPKMRDTLLAFEHEFTEGEYSSCTVAVIVGRVTFDYSGHRQPLLRDPEKNGVPFSIQIHEDVVHRVRRNHAQEQGFLEQLSTHAPWIFADVADKISLDIPSQVNLPPDTLYFPGLSEERVVDFLDEDIPALEANGWIVTRHHEALFDVTDAEDFQWYSDLSESANLEYFTVNMGIIVDNERVNVLPLILQQLSTTKIDVTEAMTVNLPSGGKVSISPERLAPIVTLLYELYDTAIDGDIRLPKNKAALLYELQRAFSAAKLRWFGDEKLRDLGQSLVKGRYPKVKSLPADFKASLRPYQLEGVSWLQFLRAQNLGGILADDMGLGKTVQTLAHLSLEKKSGRMKKPSLIVAPTSLMLNWSIESSKFLPSLKYLVFHGDFRHESFNCFSDYHVVFTTYPLILRDKELLLEQDWHYLILDEAQYIKNGKAKSTQVVQQLRADHRLCLSGTPMENHLGELWSLFHFLMPGFLGPSKVFNSRFRTPIERKDDPVARRALSLRTQPFIKRRLKGDVLTELPEKTQIIETIELGVRQQDLYESIRLAMETKVRKAIESKGVARSHIIVLDALLKLRQTCCDPRLLSLSAAKAAHGHSAKLEWLKDNLPNMVLEGRKILLFSQFTKMLLLIEQALETLGLGYVKLTGATKNRQRPINAFQEGEVPLFLISSHPQTVAQPD